MFGCPAGVVWVAGRGGWSKGGGGRDRGARGKGSTRSLVSAEVER